MRRIFELAIGMLWASPITLLMFLYVLPFWITGRYRYRGWNGIAWRWEVSASKIKDRDRRKANKRRKIFHRSISGGNIIIFLSTFRDSNSALSTELHENEHVRQNMRLGVFKVIHYSLDWLVARFFLRNVSPHYDNIYEIDARRAAGQMIDIHGFIEKINKESGFYSDKN